MLDLEALNASIAGHTKCCGAMAGMLSQEKLSAPSGFHYPFVLNMKTGKGNDTALAYKPTTRKANVWFINYCPFCGKQIAKKRKKGKS